MVEARTTEVQDAEALLQRSQEELSQTPLRILKMSDIKNRGWSSIMNCLPPDIMAVGNIGTVVRALFRSGIETSDQLLATPDHEIMQVKRIGNKRFEIVSALKVLARAAKDQFPNDPNDWQFLEV